MKKVLTKMFIVFCLVTSMILVAPFSYVSASEESVTINESNIVGVTIDNTYSFTSFICTLDQDVIGSVTLRLSLYLTDATSTTSDVTFYFNGSVGYGNSQVSTVSSIRGFRNIRSQSLIKYVDDVFASYNFPVESFPMNYYCLSQGFTMGDMYSYGTYTYPMYLSNTSGYISAFQADAGAELFVIIWSDRAINVSNHSSYIEYNTAYTLVSADMLAYAPGNRVVKLIFRNNSDSLQRLNLKWKVTDRYWFPIYQWYVQDSYNVSTDFALMYELDNEFLITLRSLKPNESSDQSSSDLRDQQSSFTDSATELFSFESDFNSNLNESLDNIDVDFNIGNTFGSKFLASASWVKSQFDTLTDNTPFGSVLSFSLLLGLALLLIGKVVR